MMMMTMAIVAQAIHLNFSEDKITLPDTRLTRQVQKLANHNKKFIAGVWCDVVLFSLVCLLIYCCVDVNKKVVVMVAIICIMMMMCVV